MLGKKYYSDNEFSLEFWFYSQISSTDEVPLVADPVEDVGVFYQNGNIVFKLDTEILEYTMPSVNQSFHVAAVYSVTFASIYVNGELVTTKPLSNFEFTNNNLNLISGPTPNINDYFLINSVAIYRYALTQSQINYHYIQGQPLNAVQIVNPNRGELFEIYDDELSSLYKFEYPNSKSWNNFVTTGLIYNQVDNCLEMVKTTDAVANTITVEDYIAIPSTSNLDSSKIEWHGDNGVSVQISTDGINYISCINGQQVPQYTLNSFETNGNIFIKITFTSSDTSRYIPKLHYLSILFYNNQTRYSINGESYIKTLEGDSGVSDYRITLGKNLGMSLSRNNKSGLRTVIDSGFEIITTKEVNTLEFFYTPETITDSGLISSTATNGYDPSSIYWHNSGLVSKTNISAIYVNGINKTAESNVSNIFKPKQLHHVVIVFASPISGNIRFNYSLYGSVSALYQYIALYENSFNSSQASSNYDLYIRKQTVSISDSSTTAMTETGVEAYDNDWVVIQSV